MKHEIDRDIEILLVEDNPADVRLLQEALAETKARYRLHGPFQQPHSNPNRGILILQFAGLRFYSSRLRSKDAVENPIDVA